MSKVPARVVESRSVLPDSYSRKTGAFGLFTRVQPHVVAMTLPIGYLTLASICVLSAKRANRGIGKPGLDIDRARVPERKGADMKPSSLTSPDNRPACEACRSSMMHKRIALSREPIHSGAVLEENLASMADRSTMIDR